MGNKQSKPNANTLDRSELQVGDVLLFTGASNTHSPVTISTPWMSSAGACALAEKGGKFLYNVRYCRWISYTFAAFVIDTSDGLTRLCGHFPASSGPRGVHPVSVQLLDAQLSSGAYDAVYVRRLLHRPSEAEMASIRAYAKSAARHAAKQVPFADEGGALVDSVKRHEDTQHSDEEVAILMESPSRRSSPLTRFQDCTSPVERFTTSRLIAEMLKHAGQVTGEGHIFSASTVDERLLAAVCELELDKQGNPFSTRALKGVVPGRLVTPQPTPYSHRWE